MIYFDAYKQHHILLIYQLSMNILQSMAAISNRVYFQYANRQIYCLNEIRINFEQMESIIDSSCVKAMDRCIFSVHQQTFHCFQCVIYHISELLYDSTCSIKVTFFPPMFKLLSFSIRTYSTFLCTFQYPNANFIEWRSFNIEHTHSQYKIYSIHS